MFTQINLKANLFLIKKKNNLTKKSIDPFPTDPILNQHELSLAQISLAFFFSQVLDFNWFFPNFNKIVPLCCVELLMCSYFETGMVIVKVLHLISVRSSNSLQKLIFLQIFYKNFCLGRGILNKPQSKTFWTNNHIMNEK